MYLLPAIDLKQGRCVRLKKGIMDTSDIFNDDPSDQARLFAADGADYIHVVDLDGAFKGASANVAAVESILSAVPSVKVELGGGIRAVKDVEFWLNKGVSRVILGTAAVKDPDFVKQACAAFPNQIVLGIDAKNGFVAVEGWAETSNMRDVDLALRFQDAGAAAIVYTNVDRDGVLQGPDLESTLRVSTAVSTPVIVSGGIACLADLGLCKLYADKNLAAVIVGRALYEHRFTVAEALALLQKDGK